VERPGSENRTQYLNSSFGIVMITLSLMAIATVQKFVGRPYVQQGVETLSVVAILACYLICMSLTHRYEQRETMANHDKKVGEARDVRLLVRIGGVSLFTIAAAWWLTQTGDVLSEHPIGFLGRPLGKTFVGVCFLALATSLPEIATSLASIQMGSLHMALGNVFGSNMFNILVLPFVKIATLIKGDRLLMDGQNFSASINVQAGLLPILLTAIAVAGLAYRTQRRVFGLGFDSVVLLAIYVLGLLVTLSGGGER
jgi:cation:H+ antiporter